MGAGKRWWGGGGDGGGGDDGVGLVFRGAAGGVSLVVVDVLAVLWDVVDAS